MIPLPVLRRAGRIALLSIAFVVPLAFSLSAEDGFELVQTVGALCFLSFLALLRAADPEKSGVPASDPLERRARLSLLLFMGLGLASFLLLLLRSPGAAGWQGFLFLWVPFLWLTPLGTRADRERASSFLVAAGTIGALYSLAQAAGWDLSGWSTKFTGRSFSTLGNPVFWAGYLLVLFPLAVRKVLGAVGVSRAAWSLGVLLLAASLLVTQTRAAWIGVAVQGMVLAVWIGRRKRWVLAGLFLIVLAATVAVPEWRARVRSMSDPASLDAQGRYFMWEAAVRMWRERPLLGVGPSGYAAEYPRVQSSLLGERPDRPAWRARHAHNEALELLGERGTAGAVAGGLFALFLVFLWSRRARGEDADASHAAAVLAVFAGLGVYAVFHFPFSIVPIACAAAIVANPSWKDDRGRSSNLDARAARIAAAVLLAGLAAWVSGELVRNSRLHEAVAESRAGRFERALGYLAGARPLVGRDERVEYRRAEAFELSGRLEEASSVLEAMILRAPFEADAYAGLCRIYGKAGRWEASRRMGALGLGRVPSHEPTLANMAMMANSTGRPVEAAAYLDRLAGLQEARGDAGGAAETREKARALRRR